MPGFKKIDPKVGKKTQFKPGQVSNPAGKPKGTKNLATIIRELENNEYNWDLIPVKQKDIFKKFGAPWRAIVGVAIAKACSGDIRAAEWLAKFGYGEKVRLGGLNFDEIKIVIVDESEDSRE